MTRMTKIEPKRRIHIDWDAEPYAPNDEYVQLRRTTTFYPITASGTVQWKRGDSFTTDPIMIAADELATVIAELADALHWQAVEAKKEVAKG